MKFKCQECNSLHKPVDGCVYLLVDQLYREHSEVNLENIQLKEQLVDALTELKEFYRILGYKWNRSLK